jgi:transcriptional regulator with PAS, ATPase and Fis domain
MDREAFKEHFNLVGNSEALNHVVDKVIQVAPTDITILLEGESGVGKDITARAIHQLSSRKHDDLVIVNCGAIPEGIIESELFGHEKGAFTGAHEGRQGYFEKADNGTIFLDEIGDTPKNIQVKLLRVLENGEYFRVGSSKLQQTDVRIVAASNQNLYELVKEGKFREDLYYRLDTVKIRIPPLRERKEDIIPIFRTFVSEYASKYDSVFKGLSEEAEQLLTSYRWPGNVRELRNIAEQLVVLEQSQYVDTDTLRKYLKGRQHEGRADNLPILSENERSDESNFKTEDRELIYRVLLEVQNDIGDLKKMLGSFLYNAFSKSNIRKALPEHIHSEVERSNMPGFDPDEEDGQNLSSNYREEEQTDQNEFYDFINSEEIPSIENMEQFLIQKALQRYDGNRRKASEALGISERTLYRKLDQYGIE